MATQTTTIPIRQSAYIDSQNPNQNFKSELLWNSFETELNSSKEKRSVESYLSFDPQGLPQKRRISGITLRMYLVSKRYQQGPFFDYPQLTVYVRDHMPTNVDTITWSTRPSFEKYLAAGRALLSSIQIGQTFDLRFFATEEQPLSKCLPYLVQHGCLNLQAGFEAYTNGAFAACEVRSTRTANPPVLLVTSEEVAIRADAMTPSGGFVDKQKANLFTWTAGYDAGLVLGEIKAASALFRWRVFGESAYSETKVVGDRITVPAGTFPANKKIEWQVVVTADTGTVGAPSGWIVLTTIDSAPSSKPVSPVNTYLSGGESNLFTWRHITETGSKPSRSELQYSVDGTQWRPLASVTGAAISHLVPPNTLPGGTVIWRVRTANTDGIWGPWSEGASFIVYAAPKAPVLGAVEPSPRPVLRWQSPEQQAFEARAGDWSSGPVFGTAKELRVPVWLRDGSHEVGVRVQSSIGLWSGWGRTSISVRNHPPGEVVLRTRGIENGARLSWTGTCERYLIYRDGAQIGETGEHEWIDWLANGKHRYQVRGIVGEYYSLSNEVVEYSRCPHGVLSAVDAIEWIPLRVRRGGIPSLTTESGRQVKMRYFAGRDRPVAEVSEFVDRAHTLEYSLKRSEREYFHRLLLLEGKTVIYKNQHGVLITGLLTGVSGLRDWSSDFTLNITETDWREYGAD